MLITKFDAKHNRFAKIKYVDIMVNRFKYNNEQAVSMIFVIEVR
jgi:hypothetical protein